MFGNNINKFKNMTILDDFYYLLASDDSLYTIVQLFSYFLDGYMTCIELRFCISWFLNINPYFEPFNTLWTWTDSFFSFGRDFYPKIFMVDIATMVNYLILEFARGGCNRVFYMHKTYIGEDLSPEILKFLETYHQQQN